MKRTIVAFAGLAVVAGVMMASGRADEPRRRGARDDDKVRQLMHRKLEYAQKVLEGIALEDFRKVAKNAEELIQVSKDAEWVVVKSPKYEIHSNDFRRVWMADLGTGHGHEQSRRRPALVLSINGFNAGPAELVLVVPLTSKTAKSKNIPAPVRVAPPEAGLKTLSVLLGDQLRAMSKDRLGGAAWGTVSAATLARVENAVRMLLGL